MDPEHVAATNVAVPTRNDRHDGSAAIGASRGDYPHVDPTTTTVPAGMLCQKRHGDGCNQCININDVTRNDNHSSNDNGDIDSKESSSSLSLTKGELMMAREMEQLSLRERQLVYEDIHGVADEIDETPGFLKSSLEELESDLEILNKDRAAYDHAMFLNPDFCTSRAFRLMFLRSEKFDTFAAARKILKHFELKERLFGKERLVKKIRWGDLSDDDRASIQNGSVQLFSDCRDRSGRPIYFIVYAKRKDRSIENHMRCAWYLTMSTLQDNDEVQRKGLVAVSYAIGMSSTEFCGAMIRESSNMIIQGLPLLARSAHICLQDHALKPLFSMLMAAGPPEIRIRLRLHFGSHIECQYHLNSFGIPSSVVPINADGSLKMDEFRQRLEALKLAEAHEEHLENLLNQDTIPFPMDKDVISGKGVRAMRHPGTVALMKMVQQAKPRHDAASRTEKTKICEEIVAAIKADGGRFLRRKNGCGGWCEVEEDMPREKVAQGFRNLRKSKKRKHS